MNIRHFLPLLVAALLFAALPEAEAKRRGGGGFVPIPGLGGGESIVKVTDLPDIPVLLRSDGKYIDLGYLHKSGGEGEWIGYIGSSSSYLPLDETKLEMLLLLGGLDELPPVPEKKGISGGAVVLTVIFVVFMYGRSLLRKIVRALSGGGSNRRGNTLVERANRRMREDDSSVDWDEIDRKIGATAAEAAAATPAPARAAGRPGPVMARRANPGGGFGRRGV